MTQGKSPRRLRRRLEILGASVVAAVALAACGGSAHVNLSGGKTSASVALPPNSPPFYIMPLTPLTNYNGYNSSEFQWNLYRPLYWFGENGKTVVNAQLSLAAMPSYRDSGRVAVVKLKHYAWSDGKPVSSRDVVFWMNLLRVAKDNWASYVPGAFPDNVVSVKAVDPTTVVFRFDRTYNPNWLLYNELSQITPIPQHAWDRTSAGGAVGNYDETPAGAKRVYKFLLHEGNQLSSYTTNPLWKVIDGPWRLRSFSSSDNVTFVPNRAYSGPVKPTLKRLQLVPFTSDTAEFNVLRGGGNIDFGYIPAQDASLIHTIESQGFKVTGNPAWTINFMVPNYNNPTVGPLFKQLYIRQAMESLIDQRRWVKTILHGYGAPTTGPVPLKPANPFASRLEKKGAYPYNPGYAKRLLRSHGWKIVPNGASTCARPGSGAGQCGAGVRAGKALQFNVEYDNGIASLDTGMQAVQSAFSYAGIKLNLQPEPLQTVNAHEVRCTPKQSKCAWQLIEGNYQGWTYEPDYYPSGGQIFGKDGGSNSGGFYDPVAERLIDATHHSTSSQAMISYEDYMARQLPNIWLPIADTVMAVRSQLQGTQPTDPFGSLYAENWSWGK